MSKQIKRLADRIRTTSSILTEISGLLGEAGEGEKDNSTPALQSLLKENTNCGEMFNSIQKKIAAFRSNRMWRNEVTIVEDVRTMEAEVEFRKNNLQLRLILLIAVMQYSDKRR